MKEKKVDSLALRLLEPLKVILYRKYTGRDGGFALCGGCIRVRLNKSRPSEDFNGPVNSEVNAIGIRLNNRFFVVNIIHKNKAGLLPPLTQSSILV